LVVEPINGRDKVVEGLMRGRRLDKGFLEKEDKGEERTREGDLFLVWVIFLVYGKVRKIWRGRRRREETVWAASVFLTVLLEDSHRGTCCWEFWARGPGNHKESWG
jgi:hypothetical protein